LQKARQLALQDENEARKLLDGIKSTAPPPAVFSKPTRRSSLKTTSSYHEQPKKLPRRLSLSVNVSQLKEMNRKFLETLGGMPDCSLNSMLLHQRAASRRFSMQPCRATAMSTFQIIHEATKITEEDLLRPPMLRRDSLHGLSTSHH
jgi:hypothetical protein